MKKTFLGLQIAPVDKMLDKLQKDYLSEKNHLEYEVQSIIKENNKLQAELMELSLQKTSQLKEDPFWRFGSDRLNLILHYFDQQEEQEMSSLRDRFEEKSKNINQQIEDLNKEIKSTDRLFLDMLNQLTEMVEKNERKVIDKEDVSIIENQLVYQEEIAESLVGVEGNSEIPVFDNLKESIFDENNDNNFKDTLKRNNTTVEDGPHESDSFWGKIDEWLDSDVDLLSPMLAEAAVGIDGECFTPIFEDDNILKESSGKQENQSNNENTNVLTEQQIVKSQLDDELVEQIDSIKSQYIVGKMAGVDLLDLDGHLIVSKSSFITQEIVEKANQAGKLAELIVNMKLHEPGVV
ncbi:MAG: hypothetical protein Q8934_10325 [Bacillota bacterium]|nr:hypothetical protein [Bacillota bacterium]